MCSPTSPAARTDFGSKETKGQARLRLALDFCRFVAVRVRSGTGFHRFAVRGDLRDEHIERSARVALRLAGHVGIAAGIHHQAMPKVAAFSPELQDPEG